MEDIILRFGIDASSLAEGIREAVAESKSQLEQQFTSSVDKAKAKIEEMNQKMRNTNAIIDENTKRIDELTQKREKASAEEKRRLDEELASLKKTNLARQDEILKIDEKRTKATEMFLMINAKTDQEKEAIRQTSAARSVDLGIQRDQARAQNAITDEVEKTSGSLKNYFQIFGAIAIVNRGLQVNKDLWALQRREIDLSNQSLERQKELAVGEGEKNKSFFQEFGLRTQTEKDAGQAALVAIGGGGDMGSVQTAAGNIGANLRDMGINSVNDPRFAGLVGAAGRAQFGGINTANLNTLFQANPNMTGDQLQAQLGKILTVTGSPSRANSFLEAYQQNQLKLQSGGIGGLDNALKLFQGISSRTSRAQAPEIFTQFASALDKFAFGKNMEQRGDLASQLAEAGAPGLASTVMQGPQVNAQAIFSGFSKLDPLTQEKVARVLGAGSRGGVALNAAAGLSGQTLPSGGGIFLGPTTNAEQAAARQAYVTSANAIANQPSVAQSEFRKLAELEKTRLLANPDEMSPSANPNSWIHSFPFIRMMATDSDVALPRQAAKNVFANRMNDLQEMSNRIGRGELSAPAGTINEMLKLQTEMMEFSRDQDGWGPGEYPPGDVAPFFERSNALMQQAGPATRPTSTTRPSTRPSTMPTTGPSSINYHIRQVNYGMPYDSIGAPAQPDSRLS